MECPKDWTACNDFTCLKFVPNKVPFIFAYAHCREKENASLFTPTDDTNDRCAKKLANESCNMEMDGALIFKCALKLKYSLG